MIPGRVRLQARSWLRRRSTLSLREASRHGLQRVMASDGHHNDVAWGRVLCFPAHLAAISAAARSARDDVGGECDVHLSGPAEAQSHRGASPACLLVCSISRNQVTRRLPNGTSLPITRHPPPADRIGLAGTPHTLQAVRTQNPRPVRATIGGQAIVTIRQSRKIDQAKDTAHRPCCTAPERIPS